MKKLLLPALALAALGLTGCATSVNTVQRANPQATPSYVADQRIITDTTLARKLATVSINESKVSGNLLKIQVTLLNLSSRPQTFLYKFDWIADDGMELTGPIAGWKTIQLEGKEERSISAIATSPRAVDFRFKAREK